MKVVKVIHNPTAGNEEFKKSELISKIERGGFICKYSSRKKRGWKNLESSIDFLVAAGGDGTIRSVVKMLLGRKAGQKTWPIALLPLGTANNIAKTLGISGETQEIIESWQHAKIWKLDIGRIHNLNDGTFFLEGMGFGVLPYLFSEMKKQFDPSDGDRDIEINTALALLHQIVLSYEPRHCELQVDGTNHSGKFLMAEVMNIRSIGPGLMLAPDADPADGEFEIVLLPEKYKDHFATYLTKKIAGDEEEYRYDTLKGKNIRIIWDGTHVHVDGKVLKMTESTELLIELKENAVEFLVPNIP